MKNNLSALLFEGGSLSAQKKKKTAFRSICITFTLLMLTLAILLGYFAISAIGSASAKKDTDEIKADIGSTAEISLSPDGIYKGELLLLDASHPLQSKVSVTLIAPTRPKNEKTGTPMYSLMGTGTLKLNEDTLKQFNLLASAFFKASGDDNLLIYNAYDETKSSQAAIYESGSSLSLGYYSLEANGEYKRNTSIYGVSTYNWVYNNAYKYGFVVLDDEAPDGERGSNVFRYVGVAHATAMHLKKLDLPEYLNMLKDTTPEAPLTVSTSRINYAIYYLAANGEHRVPTAHKYSVSGNNVDGYIVTVEIPKK